MFILRIPLEAMLKDTEFKIFMAHNDKSTLENFCIVQKLDASKISELEVDYEDIKCG